MAYAKLYCKKNNVKKDGTSTIYHVIKLNGKERLLSTGFAIAPSLFDNESGTLKRRVGYSKLNATLQQQSRVLNDIILDVCYSGQPVSFDVVICKFTGNSVPSDFIEFAFSELESLKEGMAVKTFEDYRFSLLNLKEYVGSLRFEDLTYEFLIKFEVWLKHVKNRNQNSRYHNFAAIRKFLNLAIKYGHTKSYPFQDFRFKPKPVDRDFLTECELSRLQCLYDDGNLRERQRNTLCHFLFACYTGIAGDDLRHKERLKFFEDIAVFERGKTSQPVKVPLSNLASRLVSDVLSCNLKMSKSRVNRDLRELMVTAGIDKSITFHSARHTFAILSLKKNVSLSVVSKVLGHTSTKTTETYARVVDDLIKKEMAKWDE